MEFQLTPRLRDAVALIVPRGGEAAAALAPCAREGANSVSLVQVQLLSSQLRELPESERPPHVWVREAPHRVPHRRPCHPYAFLTTQAPTTLGPQVHELLQGAAPLLPAKPEKRAPHPDLAPRLEQLRAAEANREYAAMMGDVHGQRQAKEDSEIATYKTQMGVSRATRPGRRRGTARPRAVVVPRRAWQVGLNLIVSMGTMYTVGHYAGGTQEQPHGPRAVLCGLALMVITLLIEVTLFIIGASRIDAKAHRRAEAAAKGLRADLTTLQQNYGPRLRTGPKER